MTIIPSSIYRPFRRFEVVAGLLCLAVAVWTFLQLMLWLAGGATPLVVDSLWGAVWLGLELMFLLGFGCSLISSGYIPVFFWLLALYAVINMQLTARIFG